MLKRKQITKLLIESNHQIAMKLAKEIIDKYECQVIKEPEQCLIMAKVRESAQNTLFYLGEVLATECIVKINNKNGFGIVVGNNTKLSKSLAIIDAAIQSKLPEVEKWNDIFSNLQNDYDNKLKKLETKLSHSIVNFETMQE